MRVTIAKPNVFNSYGTLLPQGSIQTVDNTFGQSLVYSLQATDTDGVLPFAANSPFSNSASSIAAAQFGISNMTPQNTGHVRAAVARVLAGTGICKVAFIGDSIALGAFANAVTFAGNKPLAYPAQLAKILTARGLPATNDSWFGSGNVAPATAAGYTAYNAAVTYPIAGFAPGSIPGLGAFAQASTTSGATLAFTPTMAFDTIDIYFLGGIPAGTFNVNVDGGASLQLVTPGGPHVPQVVTIACALATHTINIVTTSTSGVFIAGMAVRASATPRVELYNCGWSAALVSTYAEPTSATFQYNYFVALPVMAPDITVINLTVNDIDQQPTPVAAYQTKLQSLVAQALVSGDCALMVGNPGNKASWTTNPGVAAAYQAAVSNLASAAGIPLIDLTQRWTSYAVTNPVMPYGDPGVTALHPGQVGHADIAKVIAGLFAA